MIAGISAFVPRDWAKWARENVNPHYMAGWYAVRREDNPYAPGTWEHKQWDRGYVAAGTIGIAGG